MRPWRATGHDWFLNITHAHNNACSLPFSTLKCKGPLWQWFSNLSAHGINWGASKISQGLWSNLLGGGKRKGGLSFKKKMPNFKRVFPVNSTLKTSLEITALGVRESRGFYLPHSKKSLLIRWWQWTQPEYSSCAELCEHGIITPDCPAYYSFQSLREHC